MATFSNGESGSSVRTKINAVLQHADGTAGELVINDAGADVDFRVESDTNANALFVDGASGSVGIGTSAPSVKLDVSGSIRAAGSVTIGAAGTYEAGVIYSDTNWGMRFRAKQSDPLLADFVWANSADTERLRIDASGNLLVGTTSNPGGSFGGEKLVVSGTENTAFFKTTSTAFSGTALSTGRTSSGIQISFHQSGSYVGDISTTATATSYNTSSDYRLKKDLQPIADASSRLAALNPVNFAWKADGTRTDGFIAHEVQAVIPQAVAGEKDATDEDGNPIHQGIDQSKLVPLLTAALQEALAKIASIEARLDALEA